jgi:hypothetical protein
MREGGPALVPIATTAGQSAGTAVYNNTNCNVYTVQVSSTNGSAQTVGMIAPENCWVSPTSLTVPAAGSATLTVYVPTSINGHLDATATETGFTSRYFTVRP